MPWSSPSTPGRATGWTTPRTGVGNVADIEDENGARLRMTVLGRTGPAWDVEISFTPAPHD